MKKCNYCKAENNDYAQYCSCCGLPLLTLPPEETPEPVQEDVPAPKKKRSRLPILLGSAGAVTLAIVILVVFLFQGVFQNNKFVFPKADLLTLLDPSVGNSKLIANAQIVAESEESALHSVAVSLDGSVELFWTVDSKLYVGTKEDLTYLADADNLALAVSGKRVAYVDLNDNLYLQKIPVEEEALQLSNQILPYSRVAVSPDGNAVAFVEQSNEDSVLYAYYRGNRVEIGKNLSPISISDEGKYIYCASSDNLTIYVADMTGKLEKIAETTDYFQYCLNKEHTQMMFWTNHGWRVIAKGEMIELSDSDDSFTTMPVLNMVTPEHISYVYSNSGIIYTYGVETLAGNYYEHSLSSILSYLDENWEFQEISQSWDYEKGYGLSRDGAALFYIEENRLYQVKNADMDSKKRLAKDVSSFCITSDGKAVYYLDAENALWYQPVNGEATKIQKDVVYSFITHDNYLLFLINNDVGIDTEGEMPSYTLYAVKNDRTPVLVDEDVISVRTTATATYYYKFNAENEAYVYDFYGTEKGIDFQFIAKEG